ncbi:MAG: cytochrome b [Gammaproteobacteria bacterium]|nr:cytochrome b [Gammaproteobacteria bacterium]
MNQLSPARRYSGVSKALHWVIALLAFSQLAMGKFFEVEADEAEGLFGWHTALGLLVLALMLVRLGWRLTHAVPRLPEDTPGWQQVAARTMHIAFYTLLIALPLSGWLLTSVEGDPVTFFGWFGVPPLPVPGGEASEDLIEETHEVLGNVLLVLAGIHVLAGLKHHYIDRDDVLRRMMPGSG